jgi:hypothetical protein
MYYDFRWFLIFQVPPKLGPTLSIMPFACNPAMCLWVFFLDNDRASAIFEMETDGVAEMMARILVSVSLSLFTHVVHSLFTPVVHPHSSISCIIISNKRSLEYTAKKLFWGCRFVLAMTETL